MYLFHIFWSGFLFLGAQKKFLEYLKIECPFKIPSSLLGPKTTRPRRRVTYGPNTSQYHAHPRHLQVSAFFVLLAYFSSTHSFSSSLLTYDHAAAPAMDLFPIFSCTHLFLPSLCVAATPLSSSLSFPHPSLSHPLPFPRHDGHASHCALVARNRVTPARHHRAAIQL